MTEYIIRQAQSQDLATLVRFNQALVEEARGKKLEPQILTKGVEAVLNDPNRGFYTVVQVAGIVAAAALVTFEWSDRGRRWTQAPPFQGGVPFTLEMLGSGGYRMFTLNLATVSKEFFAYFTSI